MKKLFILLSLLTITLNLNAIILPEGTDARITDVETNKNGKITRVVLTTPTVINTPIGAIEAKGEVLFTNKGTVKEFTPHKAGTYTSPRGTINYLGYEVIKFYNSGMLYSITLSHTSSLSYGKASENKEPDFLLLKAYTNVVFYESGNIHTCVLSQPTSIPTADGNFTATQLITLSDEGVVLTATATSDEGIDTKYGKVYPEDLSYISFYNNGKLKKITPADITQIRTAGKNLMTVAKTPITFSKNGLAINATIKSSSINFYGWDIELHSPSYTFILYPNNRIYIMDSNINTISTMKVPENSYGNNLRNIIIDKENCYYWGSNQNTADSIYRIKKEENKIYRHKSLGNHTTSHFTKEGEIDLVNPPLIFNENNEIIGYRRRHKDRVEYYNGIADVLGEECDTYSSNCHCYYKDVFYKKAKE